MVAPRRHTGAEIPGILDVIQNARISWHLFQDPRVPLAAKVVAVLLVAVYLLFPIDFIPDPVLGLGQLDDLALILIGMKVLQTLSPADVVREYVGPAGKRRRESGGPQGTEEPGHGEGDYIDAEYRVVRDD